MILIKQLSLFAAVSPCCLSATLNDKHASKKIIYAIIVASL